MNRPVEHSKQRGTIDNACMYDPPETKAALERLLRQGITRDEAIKFICCAFLEEFVRVVNASDPYDIERYIAHLKRLPVLPWELH